MKGNGLVLDFETVDPYLSRDLGPGWVYKVHNPKSDFRVIGYSWRTCLDGGWSSEAFYYPLEGSRYDEAYLDNLKEAIRDCDWIVFHNAPYDLGCLRALGIEITHLKVYDTKVMALLYDNTLESTGLSSLSKKFLPSDKQKETSQLVDAVIRLAAHGLAPFKSTLPSTEKALITLRTKMTKWAYQHMDIIQKYLFEFMDRYGCQDAVSTAELFEFFLPEIGEQQAAYYSNFQLIFTKMRERGIKIDEEKIKDGIAILRPRASRLWSEITAIAGRDFNIDSGKQLAEVLTSLGASLPKTNAGNFKTDKRTLEIVKHPIIDLIREYKEINYICSNHFEKIYEIIEETGGYVYPEFNLLGAVTGRSSSSHPNIMGVPKRHPVYGPLVRSTYIPSKPSNSWFKLDWSNQEPRLAVNDAHKIGAKGIQKLVDAYNADPNLSLHDLTAKDMGAILKCTIEKDKAKIINLGLMYGMGSAKLAISLGLPVVWSRDYGGKPCQIAGPEGLELISAYYEAAPWLKELKDKVTQALKQHGYIRTIGGRKLRRQKYVDSNGKVNYDDYKALNKRIQGSASDQCLEALRLADEAGINVKFPVHDEFDIEGTVEDAIKMQEIMETSTKLCIPSVAEIEEGTNWGNVKKVNRKETEKTNDGTE